ncbi:MAG: hypothetical protein JWM98_1501 [Thermoleophilia bacterium]|nr:hypothetical protein [Thermoleophilia bacterium]
MQVCRRLAAPLSILALAAAFAVPAASSAAGWTQVSEHSGHNYDETSAVRGADGTLHIVYADDLTNTDAGIRYRTMGPTGVLGSPQTVISGWSGRTSPDIELVGGVPTAFFSGLGPAPTNGGQVYTASLGASGWALSPTPMSANTAAYSSDQVSSVLDGDAAPWTSFSSTFGVFVHTGFATAGPEANYQPAGGCCGYGSNLGRNPVTGEIVLFYKSNATNENGYYRRTVSPTVGAPVLLPRRAGDTSSLERGRRMAAAVRTTTGDVTTAYCAAYPTCNLLRVTGASSFLGLRLADAQVPTTSDSVWTASAPNGRMWLSWSNRSGVFATRSNKAFTKWGPIQRLALPAGTDTSWTTSGDGSLGPLDLFTNLTATGGGTFIWTRRIQPALTVTPVPARVLNNRAHTVRIRLTDAGDPVVGGSIRFRGVTRRTGFTGYATFTLPAGVRAGFYPVSGSSTGYVSAAGALRVLAPARR